MTGLREARGHVGEMVTRLREEMRENEQRRKGWYLDLRDIVTRAQFAAGCATREMIRDAWERMEGAAHALERHMGDIVAGSVVPELKNDESFEAYEEDVPFQAPAISVVIFRHERETLRQMADANQF